MRVIRGIKRAFYISGVQSGLGESELFELTVADRFVGLVHNVCREIDIGHFQKLQDLTRANWLVSKYIPAELTHGIIMGIVAPCWSSVGGAAWSPPAVGPSPFMCVWVNPAMPWVVAGRSGVALRYYY